MFRVGVIAFDIYACTVLVIMLPFNKIDILIAFISTVFLNYVTCKFWQFVFREAEGRKTKICHFHMFIATHQDYGLR